MVESENEGSGIETVGNFEECVDNEEVSSVDAVESAYGGYPFCVVDVGHLSECLVKDCHGVVLGDENCVEAAFFCS